ncbi:STAS domain-containing protein [Streptomyces sp. A1499]|uniref:STAS domain-containing protein n=1 Tax=Streptomyces sp. A1499 TaxID=2563104 RepID=UPI00144ACE36|nr:STAS domain-containing protein [Streptomyces sp. A1499]
MTDNPFTSHAAVDAGVARVTLAGELDWDSTAAVEEAVAACLVRRPTILCLDLTGVHFCDCSGLTALFTVRNSVLRAGVELRVVGVGTQLARLLSLIGADGVLTEGNTSLDPEPTHRTDAAALSPESRLRDLPA